MARPLLAVCHSERCGALSGGRIVRCCVRSAVSRAVRMVAATVTGAFAGSITLSITSGATLSSVMIRSRATTAMAVLATASTPMCTFTARTVAGMMRALFRQWKRFAADVADDFDRLLHQTFDRLDFLAL